MTFALIYAALSLTALAFALAARDGFEDADGFHYGTADSAVIDTQSEPGAWADAIAHSPCLNVGDYAPGEPRVSVSFHGERNG